MIAFILANLPTTTSLLVPLSRQARSLTLSEEDRDGFENL
jgi:hypothetical protein